MTHSRKSPPQTAQDTPASTCEYAASSHPGNAHVAASSCGCSRCATSIAAASITAADTDTDTDADEATSRADLASIIAAAVLLATGMLLQALIASLPAFVSPVIFLVAYLVAGGKVLLHAARNIRHGQFFDENLLMSVATIGAIAVQQYPEAVGVMLFYRVGEFFEDRALSRSRSQIREAVDMRPQTVQRVDSLLEEGALSATWSLRLEDAVVQDTTEIPAAAAQVGDLLLVRPGQRIPLDGTVMAGTTTLDTSPITGEPVPATARPGHAVTSGCVNLTGLIIIRVEAELSESMVSRILDAVENAANSKPHIQRFITRFARVYTPIVMAIALLTAVIPSLVTGNWAHWLYIACTFLVISCPCAVVISVPLSFFAGIGAGGKMGILFKGGEALEALRRVRVVVMDKTGTITRGVFSVDKVSPVAGFTSEQLLVLAASAEQASTHPLAQSVLAAARERSLALLPLVDAREVAGRGLVARVGALTGTSAPAPALGVGALTGASAKRGELAVLCGNRALLEEAGVTVREGCENLAGATVMVAVDGVFAGSILVADEPKPDSAAAIASMRRAGLHTVMLTGDAQAPAQAMAAQMGVDEVHARLLPQQKLEQLEALRESHGPVMFVGDGINDAPVLAGANVGAAMGSGSDAALEAADVVFMNSSLSAVPQAMSIARAVGLIAMENIVFALVVKGAIMVLGFMGVASMWAAVFADVGVALLCILNSIRLLYRRY